MCEVKTTGLVVRGVELIKRKYVHPNATASIHTTTVVTIITHSITTAVTKALTTKMNFIATIATKIKDINVTNLGYIETVCN